MSQTIVIELEEGLDGSGICLAKRIECQFKSSGIKKIDVYETADAGHLAMGEPTLQLRVGRHISSIDLY